MVEIVTTSSPKTTKKLLVAFEASRAAATTGDFLVPVPEADAVTFFGLRSKQITALGMMVYVGMDVTVNDLFAKLVDTGRKIPNVDRTVSILAEYISQLEQHKIGTVVAIESAADEPSGFRLKRVANMPSGASDAP